MLSLMTCCHRQAANPVGQGITTNSACPFTHSTGTVVDAVAATTSARKISAPSCDKTDLTDKTCNKLGVFGGFVGFVSFVTDAR